MAETSNQTRTVVHLTRINVIPVRTRTIYLTRRTVKVVAARQSTAHRCPEKIGVPTRKISVETRLRRCRNVRTSLRVVVILIREMAKIARKDAGAGSEYYVR